jgi:Ca-activated chloride channel family protein
MSFLRPSMLWLLLVPIALAAAYVAMQRRRRHYAVRFTNLDLLDSVAPRRPGWRRHLPASVVGLALVASVIGLARPTHTTQVPREYAIVMLAIDVSGSMAATDVAPDRLEAAITAASSFVDDLPDGFQVGLVAFDRSATVLVSPTRDHAAVEAAITQLQLGEGTAAGDGIVAALDAIRTAQSVAGIAPVVAVTPDDTTAVPATIVLLSDGATTAGVPVADAATRAADAGVPVSTITFGTDTGTVTIRDQVVAVPPDAASMAAVADATGGTAFDAASTDELASVYDEIQGRVGDVSTSSELIIWFLGAAVVLLALACIGSMVWTGRFL